MGFENIQGQFKLPSPLCSAVYDIPQMTADAIHLLRRWIHHEDLEHQTNVDPVKLICRGSCGCKTEKKE